MVMFKRTSMSLDRIASCGEIGYFRGISPRHIDHDIRFFWSLLILIIQNISLYFDLVVLTDICQIRSLIVEVIQLNHRDIFII